MAKKKTAVRQSKTGATRGSYLDSVLVEKRIADTPRRAGIKKQSISCYIPEDFAERVFNVCAFLNRSRSDVTARALFAYVTKVEEEHGKIPQRARGFKFPKYKFFFEELEDAAD